jgi:hypothetical protein
MGMGMGGRMRWRLWDWVWEALRLGLGGGRIHLLLGSERRVGSRERTRTTIWMRIGEAMCREERKWMRKKRKDIISSLHPAVTLNEGRNCPLFATRSSWAMPGLRPWLLECGVTENKNENEDEWDFPKARKKKTGRSQSKWC